MQQQEMAHERARRLPTDHPRGQILTALYRHRLNRQTSDLLTKLSPRRYQLKLNMASLISSFACSWQTLLTEVYAPVHIFTIFHRAAGRLFHHLCRWIYNIHPPTAEKGMSTRPTDYWATSTRCNAAPLPTLNPLLKADSYELYTSADQACTSCREEPQNVELWLKQ